MLSNAVQSLAVWQAVDYQLLGVAKYFGALLGVGMSKKTSATISLSEGELLALRAMSESSGIPIATIAKRCLMAALDYFDQHGDVPMPPAIVRKSEAARLLAPSPSADCRETA